MTPEQATRAKQAILAAPELVDGSLYSDGRACAIGVLCLAAGVTPDRLINVDFQIIDSDDYPDVFPEIVAMFGITREESKAIVNANDETQDYIADDEERWLWREGELPRKQRDEIRKEVVCNTIDDLARKAQEGGDARS